MNKDIILIFGGDGKIAQEIVKKYLNNDCIVLAVDITKENKDKEFNKNKNYYYYSVDITNVEQLNQLFNRLFNEFGYVTHIISAAAKVFPSDCNGLYELAFDEIDSSVKLNLISHIYISKIFLPLLKYSYSANKSITFVSSVVIKT